MTEPKGLISSLDTSSFSLGDDEDYDDSIQDDYESAYFDIEKAASPNSKRRGQDNGVSSVKFETDMFNLAPANSEYDGSDEDYRDSSLLSSLSSISLPSKKTVSRKWKSPYHPPPWYLMSSAKVAHSMNGY